MKFSRKIFQTLFLMIFALSFTSFINAGHSANQYQYGRDGDDYVEGRLIKAKNSGAVYQIGADGRKYVFPGVKTYNTWEDGFDDVEEVDVEELDQYDDGGVITVQPGSKLVTTQNTARVYAVGEGGKLFHVPNEQTARNLYGEAWALNVEDIDPGIFAISYQNTGKEVSEDLLPDGTLVQDDETEDLYLIQDGQKRLVKPYAYGTNKLYKKSVVRLSNVENRFEAGEALRIQERRINQYNPIDEEEEFVVICHQPLTAASNNPQTIKVSTKALAAHLAHGDTEGECPDQEYPEPEDTCDNVVVDYRPAEGGTYWQDLGLDMTGQEKVIRYRIQWYSGYWSPWYTRGVDDIDWKDPNRRVWSYFDDHRYQIEWCQSISDDLSDISCAGGEEPELVEGSPTYTYYWSELGLDTSAHPEIKKYRIQWSSGAWSPEWYYPGENDVDWALNTRRVWSYFDDHNYKYAYCPSEELDDSGDVDNGDDNDDSDEEESFVYTNEEMGFMLTFPSEWENYIATETASSTTFGLEGDDDMFVVYPMTLAEWEDYQNQVPQYSHYIDENDDYVYVYNQGQDTLDDLVDEALLIDSIIDTFEFIED